MIITNSSPPSTCYHRHARLSFVRCTPARQLFFLVLENMIELISVVFSRGRAAFQEVNMKLVQPSVVVFVVVVVYVQVVNMTRGQAVLESVVVVV